MPDGPRIPARDLISKTGAERLARELDEYWHSRGHPEVQHWVRPLRAHQTVPEEEKLRGAIWCVRSNLIRGLPPKLGTPR